MTSSPNLIYVDPDACAEARESLPSPQLVNGLLDPDVHERYRDTLREHDQFGHLAAMLEQDLADASSARGYVAVGLPPTLVQDLRLATAVCSLAGRPFRLVGRLPLWQDLPVNLDAEPHRFGGVGYNPFHVDFVNASEPPPFTCLLLVREDPLGGGHTILSNLRRAVDRLDANDVRRLAEPVFREGKFYDLFGVGHELKRFAVIGDDGGLRVRFTAKMDLPEGPHRDSLQALTRELIAGQERLLLRPGHLVIVNNRTMAHGREALGHPQSSVPADRRRLLRQTYLHAFENEPTARAVA